MKRRLEELDDILVDSVQTVLHSSSPAPSTAAPSMASSSKLQDVLRDMTAFEDALEHKVLAGKRLSAPLHSIDQRERRILRLFLRQAFHPSTTDTVPPERAHFTLTIEGMVIDTYARTYTRGFGGSVQSLKVAVERRIGTMANGYLNSQVFDWSETQYPKGIHADVITMKIPADKNCTGKIALGINPEALNVVRISNQLRASFENLAVETTEEEIYTTLLQYISRHNLMEAGNKDRSKVSFRTDEVSLCFFCIHLVNCC